MYLIAATTPGVEPGPLLELLERAGCQVTTAARQQQIDKEKLPEFLDQAIADAGQTDSPIIIATVPAASLPETLPWIRQQSHAGYLLFYTRPENPLSTAMRDNQDHGRALKQWREAVETLLDVHRKNRRHSLLIDSMAAQVEARKFLQICAQHFAVPLDSQVESGTSREADTNIESLIASRLAYADDVVRSLVAELEASSPPLVEDDNTNTVSECEQLLADLKDLRKAADSRELESENELLLLQLHQVQEELEEYFLKVRSLQQERDGLLAKVTDLDEQLGIRNNDLEATRRSLSWRITAPLRVVTAPLFNLRKGNSEPLQLTHDKSDNPE